MLKIIPSLNRASRRRVSNSGRFEWTPRLKMVDSISYFLIAIYAILDNVFVSGRSKKSISGADVHYIFTEKELSWSLLRCYRLSPVETP
jgi:hypothetical protein